MAITYELAPNPKWYIADLVGLPLAGGTLYSYRSLNKNQFKAIFMDPAGNFPWTQPILFDENGSQGPFYFEVDSGLPDETYYLEVYDSQGVLQWTIDNFSPPGAGGGGNITTALNLNNLIINNVMWRNIGTSASPLPTELTIAPGAHSGFGGSAVPDTFFTKNNTSAVDQIIFTPFPLGSTPLTGDVTPVEYLRYSCTNTPSGETVKNIQYPITTQVQNLSNQNVVVTLWAKLHSAGGANTLTLQWLQFFGDGAGASPAVFTPIQTVTLTSSWQKFILFDTVPDVSGKILGGCGNSALYLIVSLPLDASCDIDLTKPAVYLGNVAPAEDYQTYDMIDGIISDPRTGDIRISQNSVGFGWVEMNDGTIGSATSGATTRANIDTFPLFSLIWNLFQADQTLAPMFTSAGAPIAYGADAPTDFVANNRLSLTKQAGRLLSGIGLPSSGTNTGTTWTLGQTTGNELHTLTIAEMPAHDHPGSTGQQGDTGGVGNAGLRATNNTGSITLAIASQGSGTAFNIQNPVAYYNIWIKL